MKPLRIHEEAESEIRATIARYERACPGLGSEFWGEVQHTLALILERPAIRAIVRRVSVRGTARRMPLRRFPYFIVYRDRDQDIEMIALAHTSRLPGYWRTRGV